MKLTMDSGFIVLAVVAITTVSMLILRHLWNSTNMPQHTTALVSNKSNINGIARVVDGDTLEVEGIKIRLFGIDAPEHGQICLDDSDNGYDCGIKATEQMGNLISGQSVSCLPRTKDRYGRTVAVCSVGGNDLGRELVSSGWAVAFKHYSRDYVSDELQAHNQRLGLWQGSFENPSEYRAEKRARQ